MVVSGFSITAPGNRDLLQPAACGGVGRVDAQDVLIFRLGLVVFAQLIGTLCGVEQSSDGVHVLGVRGGERRIGADRIVQLGAECEGTGVFRGNGFFQHLVHHGLGTGDVTLAGKQAGLLDGGLGITLGRSGPQRGGERRIGNQLTGTGIGSDSVRISPGGVGLIAFFQKFAGLVHRHAAAGGFAGGKARRTAGIAPCHRKDQTGAGQQGSATTRGAIGFERLHADGFRDV